MGEQAIFAEHITFRLFEVSQYVRMDLLFHVSMGIARRTSLGRGRACSLAGVHALRVELGLPEDLVRKAVERAGRLVQLYPVPSSLFGGVAVFAMLDVGMVTTVSSSTICRPQHYCRLCVLRHTAGGRVRHLHLPAACVDSGDAEVQGGFRTF